MDVKGFEIYLRWTYIDRYIKWRVIKGWVYRWGNMALKWGMFRDYVC